MRFDSSVNRIVKNQIMPSLNQLLVYSKKKRMGGGVSFDR